MTYVLNKSGFAVSTDPANPTSLWAASAAGTRCFIQMRSVGELTVLETPTTAGIGTVPRLLGKESFVDETEMHVTAAVAVVANVPGVQITATRSNA